MGLLDGFQPQQAPQPVGLLGATGSSGSGADLQMARDLASAPTQKVAQQIIQQLRKSGVPGVEPIADALEKAGSDSFAIKRIADAAVQALSGQ